MDAGLHVIVDKPAGVYIAQAREINEAAAQHPELLLGMMFNQRTDKLHIKVSPDGGAWTEALVVDAVTGRVGLGTTSPAVCLDVDGPVRVKSYTVAGVPAAMAGAGQVIFVSDEAGGATLAFSDGTSWRRVADRAVIA